MNEQSLIRGLSFFSLTLGFAQLLAPRQVARLVGIHEDHDNLIRLLGLRELSSGLGLMQGKSSVFLWSRVAGDAIDLALLGAASRSPLNDPRRLQVAMAAVAGVTALDVCATVLASRDQTDPTWRTQAGDAYESGFQRSDPLSLRASCDEAMHEQSGHLRENTDDPSFSRPSDARDERSSLAATDDLLGETARPAGAPDTPRNVPL